MPPPEIKVEQRIEAPPDALYALVSDVTRTGDWSPENVGGRWLGGATRPEVGARFKGSNRRGFRRWSTTCTVVTADPARAFVFNVAFVGVPVARWGYEFVAEGSGTVVTETWNDRRPRLFAIGAGPVMGVRDITAHTRANIETTLANLNAAATAPPPGDR